MINKLLFLISILFTLLITSQNIDAKSLHKTKQEHTKHRSTHKISSKKAFYKQYSSFNRHKINLTLNNIHAFKKSVLSLSDSLRYNLIHSDNNAISNQDQLSKLTDKLKLVLKSHKQVVRFVHIGDSHIQADMLTSVIRNGLQTRYGNAGRGIVFPWQVVKTNGPIDILSVSNKVWLSGRISLPHSPIEGGVCGYGLRSSDSDGFIEISLKPGHIENDSFDLLHLFVGKNSGYLSIKYDGIDQKDLCINPDNSYEDNQIVLRHKTNSINISRAPSDSSGFDFYGISLEKKNASGIIYHTIGVNGAEFASYNKSPLFWEQIGALNADCYIISLGTNEAQNTNLKIEDIVLQVKTMINKLKQVSPDAVFIITTPPASYFHHLNQNPLIKTIAEILINESEHEKISAWDLYSILGSDESSNIYKKYGLYRPDFIHFNRQGYELQGEMLLTALLKIIDK